MQRSTRTFADSAQALRLVVAALLAAVTVGLSAPAAANPAKAAADREFDTAVQFYKSGRHAPAFGVFAALANRGDVDAARIALFMNQYGALLHGRHWEAGREDVEYWTMLVRNSSTAGRPHPDFVPMAVVSKSRVKQVRAPAQSTAATMGNR
jgi:hypothetical protein